VRREATHCKKWYLTWLLSGTGSANTAGRRGKRSPPAVGAAESKCEHRAVHAKSLKEECLDRMIFFGEKSLQAATTSYVEHYLRERNHQGMDNRLLIPGREVGEKAGEVVCRERLGGLLRYYYRQAA
jgi:hypothetical protein